MVGYLCPIFIFYETNDRLGGIRQGKLQKSVYLLFGKIGLRIF